MPDRVRRPLDGIRIVETASYLTGPFTALMLADLGAEVVKVEPPDGDLFRRYGHRREGWSAMWTSINRGKRSIALDLKSPDDLATMRKLLADADVLVENWRPHVAEKLGLGRVTVRELNPRLVRLSISGYGDSGPLARKPGFDPLVQGRTGMTRLRDAEGPPELAPYDVVDKVVGVFGAQAILAALYERERTRQGSDVSLPMLDVVTYFNIPDMFQHRTFVGDESAAKQRPSSAVATSDGFLIITPVAGQQMSKALLAIGRPDIKAELLAIKDQARMIATFYERLGEVLATDTTAHWLEVFEANDVPAGPVLSRDEHLADPQVVHNELYHELETPVGPMRAARYPATFDGRRLIPDVPPPRIGEHSNVIAAVAATQ